MKVILLNKIFVTFVVAAVRFICLDHSEFGLELSNNEVLLKDDTHFYVTQKDRLDSGLCDANRYSESATYEP